MNRTSWWLETLKKISSFIVAIKFPNVPARYKYFYRDTYVCQLNQLKYFFADRVFKKKYKQISYEGEFGAELQFCLPFAYWHYKNGTLKQTNSFPFTKEFYFFSEHHTENFTVRSNEGNYNYELPRVLYSQDYDMSKWARVPLKEHYKNEFFKYEKTPLIIANRFNMEWDGPPISFLSIEMLDYIINHLKEKYTIIYNRPRSKDIVNDNSEIYQLNEHDWLKEKHPYVIQLNDLYDDNKDQFSNFNHFQLTVYAGCENFISVHGGTATLASYFGGKNIIYSQQGGEHHFKCFEILFPELSGAAITHAKNEEELKKYIADIF